MSEAALLSEAARLHDAGQFDAARERYRQVLAAAPSHARAHFLLGLLERACGNHPQSVASLQRAVEIDPAQADVWLAIGDAHAQAGDDVRAVDAYQRCVGHDRSSALGWFKLGFARQRLEQFAEAEKAYRRAARLQPVFPEAWCNLGNVLSATGRVDDAVAALQRATAQRPSFADAWRNLGVVYETGLGRREQALACFERACAENPGLADAHFSRGSVLGALGRSVEAVAAYERVFELDPAHAGAYNNLGILFLDEWLLGDARVCFMRALAADPFHAEALNNLGNVELREQRFAEAAGCFERALAIAPTFVEALNGAGLAAQELGDPVAAARWFDRAIELRPGFSEAHANLGMTRVQLGDVRAAQHAFTIAAGLSGNPTLQLRAQTLLSPIMGTAQAVAEDRERVAAGLQAFTEGGYRAGEDELMKYLDPPFYFAYRGWNNRELLGGLAGAWRSMTPELAYEAAHVGRLRSRSRVRVGFVSNYFYRHSVGMSFARLFGSLGADPRLELIGIPLGPHDDDVTAGIRSSCAGWVNPRGTLHAIREAIAALELDVLFYTDVGMDRITYPLAMSRLARVQCLSGGHPETTGSPCVDYLLSSRWLETPAAQSYYTERLVLLDAYNSVLTPPVDPGACLSRAELGIDGTRTYVCPVKLHKLHPAFDALLAAIIERDPAAQVVLFEDERQRHWRPKTEARQRLTMGAASERVRFEPWADAYRFQSWLQRADAVLDCWPFGMGTTAITALGQSIPVVTLPSDRLSGRGTQALLRMMDIDWPIATDPQDFVAKALTLAAEPDLRHRLTQDLRARSDLLFKQADCAAEMAGFLVDAAGREEAA
jgi:predicted O-linked N-acetylglucosamine transferase (SPINDLY family)